MIKKTPKQIFSENSKNREHHKAQHYLWLHDVRSAHNVGSMFRIADALGIKQLLLSGFTPAPPSEKITKTALGADESVSWLYFQEIHQVLDHLNSEKTTLIALEQTKSSVSLEQVNFNVNSFCLVAGSETIGVADEILEATDLHIHIDQYGNKHSLNVAVATGIALYTLIQKHRL
jgi:tRNA G18 (ribose-2'-O)-methylase SpoU